MQLGIGDNVFRQNDVEFGSAGALEDRRPGCVFQHALMRGLKGELKRRKPGLKERSRNFQLEMEEPCPVETCSTHEFGDQGFMGSLNHLWLSWFINAESALRGVVSQSLIQSLLVAATGESPRGVARPPTQSLTSRKVRTKEVTSDN